MSTMQVYFRALVRALLFFGISFPFQIFANQYALPQPGNAMVGEITYDTAWGGENIIRMAQQHNVGVNSILDANPGLQASSRLFTGSPVKIPGKFLLPPLPRRGIIVNLSEMRMYYFPEGSNVVWTYPVGIGKVGKTIPTCNTSITRKVVNPSWTPPADIREFNRNQGIDLPTVMGPGPDNPLGPYGLYLRLPTYLIHSTIFPESIGTRASFGCIRMHESDIKQFFPIVQSGTPVAIVDIPTKVGWNDDKLFLETHPPLEEHDDGGTPSLVRTIEQAVPNQNVTLVNWQLVAYLSDIRDGVPHEIGFRAK